MAQAMKEFGHRFKLKLLRILMSLGSRSQPLLLCGPGSAQQLCTTIAGLGATKVLLVTDAVLVKIGLIAPLEQALRSAGVDCVVYDGVEPDPTHAQVNAGLSLARQHGCDAVLAVGGGSPMDSAKIIAGCVANNAEIKDVIGAGKLKLPPLPLYAIPTTAGTGSEVTSVAVVTDTEAKAKLLVIDRKLVPLMAALDATLMTGLPPQITAATGMDALTHAVESCISTFASDESLRLSRLAVRMIFQHLPRAYDDGNDIEARQGMAMASTYAGLAFGKASVGYAHAIAHNLGALYHTPHGLANALGLAHVLDFSRQAAATRLADLAVVIGEGGDSATEQVLADRFIARVRKLARHVGIPETLDALRAQDISELAIRATTEAHGFYPVPRYMHTDECEAILRKLLPGSAA